MPLRRGVEIAHAFNAWRSDLATLETEHWLTTLACSAREDCLHGPRLRLSCPKMTPYVH